MGCSRNPPLKPRFPDILWASCASRERCAFELFEALNLRVSWTKTCTKVGLGQMDKKTRQYTGLTIHDLRRSAVPNLIRAGVPRGVAMQITGHKTEAVFERYNTTYAKDIRDALVKVGATLK